GYGFLPPSSAGLLLSQQQQQQQHGILRKHSLARLEMSADILRQKELESLHSHQRLLEAHSQLQPHPHSFPQPLSNPYPHLHTHHVISGNSTETARHSALMLLQQRNLQHQLSHRHQPHLLTHPLSVSHARGLLLASRASHPLGRRGGTRKSSGQKVTAYVTQDAAAPMAVMKREPRSLEENNSDNGSRDSDGDGREGKEQRSDRGDARHGRDLSDDSMAAEGGDAGDAASRLLLLPSILGPSSSPAHSPTAPLRHGATSAPLPNTGLPRHVGYARSDRWPTSSPGFPSALSPLSHARPARPGRGPGEEMAEDGDPGTMSAAEEEDMRAWSVDNVCTFVAALSGCAESAQAFRHHAIDGETLPLLTETHLLSTLGLRLGPALKILAQAGSRVAR
uniref:SAM domain-containing protein n=1 Tax=Petromyzon marinus TaxID=7757 RepID=S4RE48_PETMA